MILPNWISPIVDVIDDPMRFWPLKPNPNLQHRASAVLLLFSEISSQPNLTFIKRAETLPHHPGQIAFPGGIMEPTDIDPIACALREATEEVGLSSKTVLPLGLLPEISIEVTGFAVTPVISYWQQPHQLSPRSNEVAEVFNLPLLKLLDPQNQVWAVKQSYKGPAFMLEDKFIWGFTGTVLAELFSSAGLISEFVGHSEIEVTR